MQTQRRGHTCVHRQLERKFHPPKHAIYRLKEAQTIASTVAQQSTRSVVRLVSWSRAIRCHANGATAGPLRACRCSHVCMREPGSDLNAKLKDVRNNANARYIFKVKNVNNVVIYYNSERVLKSVDFLTKFQTKISWLLYGPWCSMAHEWCIIYRLLQALNVYIICVLYFPVSTCNPLCYPYSIYIMHSELANDRIISLK